ncbi:hypothetical protein GCM10010512_14140 [Streptomyces thermoviolaceus subsp. thermoviolaceus]|nr:hypothetical protein GCM10010512_14140 [Streptomyces thermoviolaceus subsp. thermoviolaceus]
MPHIKVCYSIDTQPDSSRVIGSDGDGDRTRIERRISKRSARVLPVISTPENPDFHDFSGALWSRCVYDQKSAHVIDPTESDRDTPREIPRTANIPS